MGGLIREYSIRYLCSSEEATGTASQQCFDKTKTHHILEPGRQVLY